MTFGGAYAVLAYVNQAAVYRFGWMTPSDVVAGLGLAESTPGPLIMVTQFVGFLAAYRNPGDLAPVVGRRDRLRRHRLGRVRPVLPAGVPGGAVRGAPAGQTGGWARRSARSPARWWA